MSELTTDTLRDTLPDTFPGVNGETSPQTVPDIILETAAESVPQISTENIPETIAETIKETISEIYAESMTESGMDLYQETDAGTSAAGDGGFPVTPVVMAATGGLLLLIAAVIMIFAVRRRQRRKGNGRSDVDDMETMLSQTLINAETAPAAKSGKESVRVGKLHEQGAREYQQDCFAVSEESLLASYGVLAVVADRMGGLKDGDKVSQLAVNTILDNFALSQGRGTPERILPVLTSQAVAAVNRFLRPDRYGKCGSTLVMGLLKNRQFFFLTVGDSRVYLLRRGVLMQLNREHIYQNDLILKAVNGEISFAEAYGNQKGTGLTSFLGMGEIRHMDMPAASIAVQRGDIFALMSDGVYNALSEEELLSALNQPPEQAAEALGIMIRQKAYFNQDNYTCIVLQYTDDEPDCSSSGVSLRGTSPAAAMPE